MKTALLLVSGMLCACSWQANAQDTTAQQPPTATEIMNSSQGPDMSTNSMSGGAATQQGKTRADVYQDLVRSQQNGEAARLQQLFKGGQ
ncbi:hypothetical protein LMG24238_05353 [Paraburkholderia sediminicola]|uniref:DUF4148 domain-containing protein n=1 Tax=Paraburkholderia sediminicola TaxID=458836 RepID=A0A6J5C6T1_9BURK|nr:hypothetical protein [Paraburkholderia sediminicola]CAB3726449.1 hypothetical protein LMG24238_05353 [Paraburkholderia sediminicola]